MAARIDSSIAGVPVSLLAQRALWLRMERVLVVADVHFGKEATFRARGVPVPDGTAAVDLERLSALLRATAATTLVFLGDLFHAPEAHGVEPRRQLRHWRAQHAAVEMILVEGNHDRHAGPPSAQLEMRLAHAPFGLGPLALCHQPCTVPGRHVVAGHLHPCVRLYGVAYDSVRLPCFWLRSEQTILPAFGQFTGGARIDREPLDRVFAVTDDRLYELPPLPDQQLA